MVGNKGKEKKRKLHVNLFEVLEDRYAYEGFNKFAFYCFVFFVIYQWDFLHFAMLMMLQDM